MTGRKRFTCDEYDEYDGHATRPDDDFAYLEVLSKIWEPDEEARARNDEAKKQAVRWGKIWALLDALAVLTVVGLYFSLVGVLLSSLLHQPDQTFSLFHICFALLFSAAMTTWVWRKLF